MSAPLPRVAVIDVGTNSVKFHVAERRPDGTWSKVADRAEVCRLGEGLERDGRLEPAPMSRTADAIEGMVAEARRLGAEEVAAVGTMGLRTASNAAAFLDVVRGRTGVGIRILSGEDEARIAYLAAKSGLGPVHGSLVVFDTGGGSTQFTFGRGAAVTERFSLDVGAVRLTAEHGLATTLSAEALRRALDAIAREFRRLDGAASPEVLVGMGGALTNLAAVKHGLARYDPDVVQGTVLDRAEVDRQIELYRTRTAEERRRIVGLQPARAEVILAGACVVRTVLGKLGKDGLSVSDRGLRHGVLEECFGSSRG
jgi:exopolyphosphatase/guanosine-5'-triphosphate,3'-diphosphate pyrophosphatase